jgi:type I restriction enzyme M protein
VVKTEKKGEETITTVTDKVKSWDGKLIPKAILTSEFFSEEKKAIDDITVIISDLQAQADEFEEEQTGEDGVLADCLNDKNNLDQKVVKERLKKLKTEEQGGEDYKQLKEYSDLLSKIKDHNKTLKELSALLEQNLKAKYAVLTEDEIKELLVNKKWYYSIYDGIDALYTSISHNLSARITELAERYESTLPELEKEVAEYEAKVKAHLKQMGFEL